MSISTRLITYEDSLTMPENRLEEIVNGESRIMPPATDRHGYLLWMLTEILRAQLTPKAYVILGAEFGLGIRREPVLTYRIPDRSIFLRETLRRDKREKAPTDPYIWKAPELLVECLSPANRKGSIAELLLDYQSIAVPEVWLLDPRVRLLTAYEYREGALVERLRASEGNITPLRLAASVDLEQLWRAFHEGDLGL